MVLCGRVGLLLHCCCRLGERLQGLQRIAAATESANNHHRAVERQHQRYTSLEAGQTFAGGIQRAKLHAIDGQQQPVQAEGEGVTDNAVQ